jgi:hypothetical protein
MTTQTLSGVTLQSIENYRTAAAQAVVAYRLGGRRLLGAVNGALKNSVYPRTAKLAPRTTDRMDDLRSNVSNLLVKGIDLVADGADKAIELGSSTAASQLGKVAELASGIDTPLLANGLQAAARLSLPGAKVALVVSSRVADGATALADAAGARTVRKAVRKVARKATVATRRAAAPVVRETKVAVKATRSRVAKVAKSVKAPVADVKADVKRATRRVKKAAAQATAA